MPVIPSVSVRRLSQKEFGDLAYEVMKHVFAIHSDFGRLFDEKVYKKELSNRMKGVALEVAVDVTHDTFTKRYFADVLVHDGGLFEFKATDAIHPKHRAQAIHYLLLFDLAHGKVVNLRSEDVKHEFVNCHLRLGDLRQPTINDDAWSSTIPGAECFRETLTSLLADWGTGLDLTLYEEALEYLIAAKESVPVFGQSGHLADQSMRLISPESSFKLTSMSQNADSFFIDARKLLRHTPLKVIHWANITLNQVTLTTIHR